MKYNPDKIFSTNVMRSRMIILMVACCMLLIVYIAVQHRLGVFRAMSRLVVPGGKEQPGYRLMQQDRDLYDQLLENAFLKSCITLAQENTPALVLDLQDSTASIVMGGVCVHSCPIDSYKLSRALRRMDRWSRLSFAAVPMHVLFDTANIPREPLRAFTAPKNAEEASLLVSRAMPDTAVERVAVRLETERCITILIRDNTTTVRYDNEKEYRKFLNTYRFSTIHAFWLAILTFNTPDLRPCISISLPSDDAKSIYRALPENGRIAVRM